jgi:hypothetical protein
VVYGWGWYGTGLGIDDVLGRSDDGRREHLFQQVSSTGFSSNNAIAVSGDTGTSKIHMRVNIVPSDESDTAGTTSTLYPVRADAQVTT